MTDSPNQAAMNGQLPASAPPTIKDTKIMTNREPYRNLEPSGTEPTLVEGSPRLASSQDRQRRRWDRTRRVQMSCTVVTVVSGLFAVMLVAQIILVMGEANPANGVASFVRGFAAAVSLGFDGLFTPASVKAQVLLNYGAAAIAWLALGAVVTVLIRRFALPGPSGLMR